MKIHCCLDVFFLFGGGGAEVKFTKMETAGGGEIKQTPDRLFSLWPPKKRPMFHRSLECTKETDVENFMPLMISMIICYTLIQIEFVYILLSWIKTSMNQTSTNRFGIFCLQACTRKTEGFFWKVICLLSQLVMEKNQIHECSLQIVG